MEPLLRLPLRNCRELVLARHKARQVARLLGYGQREVAEIAAAAYLAARSVYRRARGAHLDITVAGGILRITPQARGAPAAKRLAFVRALPRADHQLSEYDLAFAIAQLDRLVPPTAIDELDRMNNELLELLAELRGLGGKPVHPAA